MSVPKAGSVYIEPRFSRKPWSDDARSRNVRGIAASSVTSRLMILVVDVGDRRADGGEGGVGNRCVMTLGGRIT